MTRIASRAVLSSVTVLLLAVGLLAQDAPNRLAARAKGDTPLFTDLQELCDDIGGRRTGSASCDRAIAWAAKKFQDIGIQNVSVEPFTAKNMWLPVAAEAFAISPAKFNIRIAAAPMSPSTKAPIEAKLLNAGEATPQAFAKLDAALTASIMLIHSVEI